MTPCVPSPPKLVLLGFFRVVICLVWLALFGCTDLTSNQIRMYSTIEWQPPSFCTPQLSRTPNLLYFFKFSHVIWKNGSLKHGSKKSEATLFFVTQIVRTAEVLLPPGSQRRSSSINSLSLFWPSHYDFRFSFTKVMLQSVMVICVLLRSSCGQTLLIPQPFSCPPAHSRQGLFFINTKAIEQVGSK